MSCTWTGWMTWEQIEPFKEKIIEMEYEDMTTFHYKDWPIPYSYCELKVSELQDHLAKGSTFFWGAVENNELVAYWWCYSAPFIDRKRFHIRSAMTVESARGKGLDKMACQEVIQKASELGCNDIATHYVVENESMAALMEYMGFKKTRIEVIKTLS